MSTSDWFLFAGQIGLGIAFFVGVGALWSWLNQHQAVEFDREDKAHANHEKWAREREMRAIERHDHVTALVSSMEHVVRGVVAQRHALTDRVEMLEAAIDNHGEHLEAMGRTDVKRGSTK